MGRKRKRRGASMSGYFRDVFNEKSEWLDQKSNDEVLARYRADNNLAPDADVGKSVKQTMSNMKSILRKELREGVTPKGRKTQMTGSINKALPLYPTGKPSMEKLEELIDECLVAAKS